MIFTLPQNRWYGDEPVTIDIPDEWDTGISVMEGDSYPALSYEEMKEKIDHPIGSEPLYEMAKGKKSACIVFDDMFNHYPEYKHAITYGDPSLIKWASTWEEVMGYLGDRGAGTKCAVIQSDKPISAPSP